MDEELNNEAVNAPGDESFDYWDTTALNKRIGFQRGKGRSMPTPNFRRSDEEVQTWRGFTRERQQEEKREMGCPSSQTKE